MAILGTAVLGWTVLGQPDVAPGWGQTGLVTLDDLRRHLNLTTAENDAEMQALLSDVIGILEGETSRPLPVSDIQVRASRGADQHLTLPAVPCPCPTCGRHAHMELLSMSIDGTTWPATDYRLDGPVLSWTGAPSGAASYADQGIRIVYRAGYTSTPPWLRLAVLRLAEHLWQQTQQAPHPALGQVAGGFDESAPSTLSYLLPYQVASLIDRHRVLG